MKKIVNLTIVMILLTILFSAFTYSCSYASSNGGSSGAKTDWNVFEPDNSTKSPEKVNSLVGKIVGIITTVGIVVALATGVIIGIRFVVAAPEGKAQLKATLMPYIFGVLMLFTVSVMVGGIYSIVTSNLKSGGGKAGGGGGGGNHAVTMIN